MQVIKNFSDAELIEALRSGKRMDEAVRVLYRDHFDRLSGFIMNNSGSRQDAEDVFQEVLVNFIELIRRDKFRGESSVKTFLFAMNRNTWLNELKRRGRAELRELKFGEAQEKDELDAAYFIAGRETRNQVIQLVDKLGDICKKILLMFYYENRPIKEILDELNYENEQVVRNKKYKCLKQLEKTISGNPELKQNLKSLLHG